MIVLGLDGATFSLIEPWVESGHLPNFERLLDESISGELESTIPEITVPAWPAFATGRDPTDLDMYGFTHFNRSTLENDLSHDEFVPGKMWDAVDDQDGSAVVFNIPGSYPWQAIEGTIIAAAPEYKDEYAYPPERWDELTDRFEGYKLRNDEQPGSRAYVDLSLELVDKRFEAFDHFIEREDPDLAVGLVRATDRVAHHYWGTESTPPASRDNAVFEVYQRVDERLGEFIEAYDDEDIVVMSDHGFEKVRANFAPNVVLEREGLVSLSESGDTTKAALGIVRDTASNLLGKAGLLTFARKLVPESKLVGVPTGDTLGFDNALSTGRINWSETTALADVGQKTTLVYVLSDDTDRIDEICKRSETALRDAAKRNDISVRFERLERGGPHTPDLAMVIETPEVHASSRFDADTTLFEVDSSGHAREGIFVARGPSFQQGTIDGAEITDIAPTILHCLGYRLPESMSGDVLDVFASGSDPAERAVETYDFMGMGATSSGKGGVSGDDEREDEIKDRLRELGYLE